jgi:3-dehydroquinate dehydratase-2
MNILVINGPNLNLLGLREPDIYGASTYADLISYIEKTAGELNITVKIVQTNHEGDIVDYIQQAYGEFDAILLNPAAYTHTSIAILDALKAVPVPAAEVHLSDIYEREAFRHVSYPSMACVKTICGRGFAGYGEALAFLKDYVLNSKQ